MKKTYYYCTCRVGHGNDDNRDSRGFRLVEVDKDGICLDCGHYATAYHKEATRSEMYESLRKDCTAQNQYLGESMVFKARKKQEEAEEDGRKYIDSII